MEKRNNILMILSITVVILLSWGLTKNFNESKQPVEVKLYVCKEDSLRKVIDSLNTEIKVLNDGFDSKERRYENIIYELEHKRKPKISADKF